MTTRGRAVRLGATALGLVLLVVGTFWGSDDDFPFGPFRMYSTSNPPNAPAPDTRVEGVDTHRRGDRPRPGRAPASAAPRSRASRPGTPPTRRCCAEVADAYAERHPDAPALVEVRIVIRWHGIRDGRPTGQHTDETVVRWQAPTDDRAG